MDQPSDPMRLDVALTERLQDYAAARGIDLQEAFETALGLGLELCASESARLEGRLRDLERRLADQSVRRFRLVPLTLSILLDYHQAILQNEGMERPWPSTAGSLPYIRTGQSSCGCWGSLRPRTVRKSRSQRVTTRTWAGN